MGARGRASRGLIHGKVRYGYYVDDDGKPQILEQEAEVVRRIYALYLDGYSFRGVAELLNQEQVPAPGGDKWWARRIGDFLSDEVYTGVRHWGQKAYFTRSQGDRDVRMIKKVPQFDQDGRENWIRMQYPAIVSAAMFQQVKERRRGRQSLRNGKHSWMPWPLKGILYCGFHGKPYTVNAFIDNGWPYRRYVCIDSQRFHAQKGRCAHTMINADKEETRVADWLRSTSANPGNFIELLKAYREQLNELGGVEALNRARDRVEALDKERGRVVTVYQKGIINEGELDLKIKAINEQREYFHHELERLTEEHGELADTVEILEKAVYDSELRSELHYQVGNLGVVLVGPPLLEWPTGDPALGMTFAVPTLLEDLPMRRLIRRITVTDRPYPDDLQVTLNVDSLVTGGRESWAAIFASKAGGRYRLGSTMGIRRTRSVSAAKADRVVQHSRVGIFNKS